MSADPWYAGRHLTPGATNHADFLDGLNDQPWAASALCAQTDPEAFYPEKGGSTREAKAVCAACDVRNECLAYALEHQERFGIWGGLSERDRRRILKAGPKAPPRPCARPDCPATIPPTASAARQYHDTACGQQARNDVLLQGLNHQQIITAYQVGDITVGRLAAHHRVPTAVIATILDDNHIPRRRQGGHWTTPTGTKEAS